MRSKERRGWQKRWKEKRRGGGRGDKKIEGDDDEDNNNDVDDYDNNDCDESEVEHEEDILTVISRVLANQEKKRLP